MSDDYRSMWTELGLDLEAHDALLGVLGSAYRDIYLAQKERPEGMGYFDFVMSEVHGLRIKELLDEKAAGRKIVGSYCVFVPEEIVLAANATLVGLCSGADFAMEEVEKLLPRNTCALIKSAFGFKIGKVCPYLESADMVMGENTCDGKKKAYESLGHMIENLYVMDLPQMKSDQGRSLLKAEYDRFKSALEALTGVTITADALREAIRTVNAKRAALHRLLALRAADPAPISGLDALLANQVFFYDNPARFTASVNAICDELEKRVAQQQGVFPSGTPRILISGCPQAVPNWKLPWIVEGAGHGRKEGTPMHSAGIDIGSRSIEVVVVDAKGAVVDRAQADTGFDPMAEAKRLLAAMRFDRIMATGYGRSLFELSFEAPTVTEIKAHARGVRQAFPEARTVLDIGGQDSKAIALQADGRVKKFEMNDRCAAGTGKFLEIMACTLGAALLAVEAAP